MCEHVNASVMLHDPFCSLMPFIVCCFVCMMSVCTSATLEEITYKWQKIYKVIDFRRYNIDQIKLDFRKRNLTITVFLSNVLTHTYQCPAQH